MKLLALVLLLTIASVSAGEIADQYPNRPKNPSGGQHPPITGITQIGIEHTPCYGTCPVYTFIVNSDGTFRYHGEEYVERRGDWHGAVDPAELKGVLGSISKTNIFGLDEKYSADITDQPTTYTLVQTQTRKKIIYEYGAAGPRELHELEKIIDGLLAHAKWERH